VVLRHEGREGYGEAGCKGFAGCRSHLCDEGFGGALPGRVGVRHCAMLITVPFEESRDVISGWQRARTAERP